MTEMRLDHLSVHKLLNHMVDQAGEIILGKKPKIKLALSCLLAGGHLLLEDLPGVGKTTLARTLAHLLGLDFKRVQFTSDLLPADVIGASIYDKKSGQFHFQHGPIFTQILLADEINRATPKAQSALLEGMEENQVSVDGETRPLPHPFFVIATQNPISHIGVFPLPESQLDRFMMCLSLDYPSFEAEREMLKGEDRRSLIQNLSCTLTPEQIIAIRNMVNRVQVSDALLDYLQNIIAQTRNDPSNNGGLSPRGSLALLKGAKSWAFLENRDYTLPEDIQAVFPSIIFHRFSSHVGQHDKAKEKAEEILRNVPVP